MGTDKPKRATTYCVHCSHSFDGMHCRAHAPIVLARVNADPSVQPPRVTWTGFPLLPQDKMGCGEFQSTTPTSAP